MHKLDENYVQEFFKNKSVLILGSAPCVAKLTPDFMRPFDIIVRSNNYKVFNSCKRTDVYYSFLGGSVKKNIKDIMRDGAKFIFCRCPDYDFSDHTNGEYIPGKSFDARFIYAFRKKWFRIPYFVQNLKNYQQNYNILNRLLTTGVSSIVDILRYEPSEVYLAGFDFFTTLIHNVDEKCNLNTGHDFPGEMKLVKKLYLKNKVRCSEDMKRLFANNDWYKLHDERN